MNKEFNEQAAEIAIVAVVAATAYGLGSSDTILGVALNGLAIGSTLFLFLKIGYYILCLTQLVPVHLMVAYAMVKDRDVEHAIADMLNKRYFNQTVLVVDEELGYDIEDIESDLRQVVVQQGDTFLFYDKYKSASIAIPAKFIEVSEAIGKLIADSGGTHFSKERLSASADNPFDKRNPEHSALIDEFIAWMCAEDLAVSGGERKPYRLTEKGVDFY